MLNSYRQIDVNEYNKRVSIPSCIRVETIQAYSILDEAFIASIAKETIDDSYFAIISKNLVEDNKYKAVWISDFFLTI